MNCWVNTDNNPTQQDRPWDIPKKKKEFLPGCRRRLWLVLAVVMLCWWEMVFLKQQEFLPTLQGLLAPTPTPKSPLLPLFLPKLIPHRILGEAGEL